MDSQEALSAIHQGKPIDCEKADWPALRIAVQKKAGTYIDAGDTTRATIALAEVKRLDRLFA